jgi:hypothetical protein
MRRTRQAGISTAKQGASHQDMPIASGLNMNGSCMRRCAKDHVGEGCDGVKPRLIDFLLSIEGVEANRLGSALDKAGSRLN